MSPTEKAKELVFKKFGCKKQYALNAVDEILDNLDYDYILFKQQSEYWQEVKQEIEKL